MFVEPGRGQWARAFVSWVAVGVFAFPAAADYGGGDGTAQAPYRIVTAEQLNTIGTRPEDWDKHFALMADIDLSEHGPTPFNVIGTPDAGPFTGVFDGNGKVISNLQVYSEYGSYLGLFGLVSGEQARIVNVALVDPNIVAPMGRYVGALVGTLRNATVQRCHVRLGQIHGVNFVGGLVGKSEEGKVLECTVGTAVYGATRVGGLVGFSYFAAVTGCRAEGQVLGVDDSSCWGIGGLVGENNGGTVTSSRSGCSVRGNRYIGGLVGENVVAEIHCSFADGHVSGEGEVGGLVGRSRGGVIADCYSLAAVEGSYYVGGLAARHAGSCYCTANTPGRLARCYAAGPVKVNGTSGGLLFVTEDSAVEDSFWDIEATGCIWSDGGTGRTTSEMGDLNMYVDAGWDFVGEEANGTEDIWSLTALAAYPQLAWETTPGDFDADGDVDLRDYSIFAGQWRRPDTGFWSSGSYMAADGIIDFDDLDRFARAWLPGRK